VLCEVVDQISRGDLDGLHAGQEEGYHFVDYQLIIALKKVGIDQD
jgi:hypothetical protein